MYFRTLIVIVFMIVSATSDSIVNPCTNTGTCRLLGTTCTPPTDINSCIVLWNNTNYPCTSPPNGFGNPVVTCCWTTGCTSCRANGRFNTVPDCTWDIL
jgi:hypothetical protein